MASLCSYPSLKVWELDSHVQGNGFIRLRRKWGFGDTKMMHTNHRIGNYRRVCCKLQDGSDDSTNNGSNDPPESLFMKELRRRGISPTSLLEEVNTGTIEEEIIEEGGNRSFSKRNAIATGPGRSLTNQREISMALNSEGLEGLIPRAKLLLRLGGTFFLAFWPLILITVASFLALYLYFGPTFVHDGSSRPIAPPSYIDPYELLQEERISQ